MNQNYYLVRDDNFALFELGRTHRWLSTFRQRERDGLVTLDTEHAPDLARELEQSWTGPPLPALHFFQVAIRIARWAGGKGFRIISESDEMLQIGGQFRGPHGRLKIADSRYKRNWVHW